MQLAPKRKAFCTKTQGILHQNARHFAPKRSVFSIKTHCILHQNAEKWHKKRRVKGYLWVNCSLEMKNGLVAFGWAFSCAQCPKYMLKRPYFVPYLLQTPVNQSVINFKNTRRISPHARRFCGEGTHNVKRWCKYFTFLWLLFRTMTWFKCLTPMGYLRLCRLGLTRAWPQFNPLERHFCGLQKGTKKLAPRRSEPTI